MSQPEGSQIPPEANVPKAGDGTNKQVGLPWLFSLWLFLAGLWKTGEVAWTLLRGFARMIA